MTILQVPFPGPSVFAQILDLVAAVPTSTLSVSALPYQLSSWALDRTENVGLWGDGRGSLLAFALLQVPFATLYYGVHPQQAGSDLEARILTWASDRAQTISDAEGRPFQLSVWPAAQDRERMARLEAWGYEPTGNGKIFLSRDLIHPLEAPRLSSGFTLRHLSGESEVVAAAALLNAAFRINTMTVPWRRRILAQATYVPELDIVVEAPDGRLAAFCLCWLHPDGSVGQIEPMGTHPDFQRRGLGRAAALRGLLTLQARGARTALVGTGSGNSQSQALYMSVGFSVVHTNVGYQRTFAPSTCRPK